MKKATLICTVYNEGESIEELLESITTQSETPDEAIFVDGGSNDDTQERIQGYAEEHDWMQLIVEEGCNIAEGRNIAVENASNDYIVSTDGGCVLHEDWYREMCKAFEESDFVVGMWKPMYSTLFENVQGRIISSQMTVEEVEKGNRSASSRSVGFSVKAWKDAGGYPEELYTGEDSKFNAEILSSGYNQVVAEDAWVSWKMRPTWKSLWKQFKTYGEGDAKGGNLFTHHSEKLGLTKNLLLTGYCKVFLMTAIATLISIFYFPLYRTHLSGLLFIEFLGPFIYEKNAIIESLNQDGVRAFMISLAISQMKIWAWFIGFIGTCLKNPELVIYQCKEGIRMKL